MKVEIFTDGACIGNPGPGGWGAILRANNKTKELSGGEQNTTNNRMEITAVIKGLQALKKPVDEIEIYSDSQYVVNTLKGRNKIRANYDLWELLLSETNKHTNITYTWVKGHNGHVENERCDYLANNEAKQQPKNMRRK